MKIRFLRADPAGNITLFVMTPVEKEKRAHIAAELMKMPQYGAEQVGFLCPPVCGGLGRMEMMGGEFCGNATRAFGMLAAKAHGFRNAVDVEVSGYSRIMHVEIDWKAGTARTEMPLPKSIRPVSLDCAGSSAGNGTAGSAKGSDGSAEGSDGSTEDSDGSAKEPAGSRKGILVDLGGIVHLVVERKEDPAFFFCAEQAILSSCGFVPDAYGVMFLDRSGKSLVPVVKVPSTGTTVYESSCASGTLAAAAAMSLTMPDGTFTCTLREPGGTLTASVTKKSGIITGAFLGGPVQLGGETEVTVDA